MYLHGMGRNAHLHQEEGQVVGAFPGAACCVQTPDSTGETLRTSGKPAFQEGYLAGVTMKVAAIMAWKEKCKQKPDPEFFIHEQPLEQKSGVCGNCIQPEPLQEVRPGDAAMKNGRIRSCFTPEHEGKYPT
jgi:hypothetical protein